MQVIGGQVNFLSLCAIPLLAFPGISVPSNKNLSPVAYSTNHSGLRG